MKGMMKCMFVEKIIKVIQTIIAIIGIIVIFWFTLSVVEVGSCSTKQNYEYSKYNLFQMITERDE